MRARFIVKLGHYHDKATNKLRYPLRKELIDICRKLPYATVDAKQFEVESDLVDFYKKQAKPLFDTVFDETKHQDLKKDLDYVVFYGEIAAGPRIVISSRNEGEIKIRVWEPKLDLLLRGVEDLFVELDKTDKDARELIGSGTLFASKEIDIHVFEKTEVDEVLKGTTIRSSFAKKFWSKNYRKAYITLGALIFLIFIYLLTNFIQTDNEQNKNLVENLRLFIPASFAIALNYLAQMFVSIPSNKILVTWALARNRNYSEDTAVSH